VRCEVRSRAILLPARRGRNWSDLASLNADAGGHQGSHAAARTSFVNPSQIDSVALLEGAHHRLLLPAETTRHSAAQCVPRLATFVDNMLNGVCDFDYLANMGRAG
jgi:hypothetical protein